MQTKHGNIFEPYGALTNSQKHLRLRMDQYKYFVYYEHNPKIEELYDLEKDPLEQNNLTNDPEHAVLLVKLRDRTEEM